MTKVEYQATKRVIIHEYAHYKSLQDLVRTVFGGSQSGATVTVQWVDGIVLKFNALPMEAEATINALMQGVLHWYHVSFAPMPKYESIVQMSDMRLTINVADVSKNPIFRDITKFIRRKWLRGK